MSLSESQFSRVKAEALDRVQTAKRRLEHSQIERDYIGIFGEADDDDAPTKERLAKGDTFIPPEFSQETRRPYHRAAHKFEDLYQNGKINEGCKEAGDKLMRHYFGSLGINVSTGEGVSGEDCMEYPRSYHSQMLTKARECVANVNCWSALVSTVEESRSLEEIGRDWRDNPKMNRGQAYCMGLALVSIGLEKLSVLWGFSQSYHSRNPPSR